MLFSLKKSSARALIRGETNAGQRLVAEKNDQSPKINKFRRLAVDGLVNDKKTLRMMDVLASRLFQLTNAYILESENTEKDK